MRTPSGPGSNGVARTPSTSTSHWCRAGRWTRSMSKLTNCGCGSVAAGCARVLPSGLLLGQVIQERRGRKLVSVTRRAVVGAIEQIEARLQATGTGSQIHTAYIERLNSTFRCSWAHLARRSRSLADQQATLVA